MACHTGRENGDSVKKKTGNWSTLSFINSHYLTAGGTVFTVTGYEYALQDYSNPARPAYPFRYEHDKIGLDPAIAPGTGTDKGPCVGCHMSAAERHIFLPVRKDPGGVITAITCPACANCHSGAYSLTPAILEAEKGYFNVALEALKAELATRGYNFISDSPYFTNRNWLSPGDVDTTGNTSGKNNMGAAFNYNLLVHDPGAFAHNRYYVKRLIYDSIDWLDDNILNGSVAAAINSLGALTAQQRADALSYLNNGVRP